MEQSKLMAKIAYHALDDKQGEDIKVIDISQISVLADYFIIAYSSIIDSKAELSGLVDPDAIFEYTKEYKDDDDMWCVLDDSIVCSTRYMKQKETV